MLTVARSVIGATKNRLKRLIPYQEVEDDGPDDLESVRFSRSSGTGNQLGLCGHAVRRNEVDHHQCSPTGVHDFWNPVSNHSSFDDD
jgi:hypothetical protein